MHLSASDGSSILLRSLGEVGLSVGRTMPDMTPMDMQKKGSATSVFQRIAEVALQDLAVFRNGFTLVRVPCDNTIIETSATLQFGLYSCGAGNGASTRYRSKT